MKLAFLHELDYQFFFFLHFLFLFFYTFLLIFFFLFLHEGTNDRKILCTQLSYILSKLSGVEDHKIIIMMQNRYIHTNPYI